MKTLRYIALAALTLSFAACEKDNDFQGVSDPDAVKINATIGAMQTRVSYSGENGVTSFEANDQIRVINHTRAGKNKSDAIYKTDGNDNWLPVDDDNYLVWQGVDANTFYGIYPATASYTEFTLPTNQSDAAKLATADWMTDDYEKAKNDGIVSINFQHRLAKVTVKITRWNTEYANAEKVVSEPTIYSKGLDLTAAYGDNVEITASDNGGAISAATTAEEEYTAIVMPAAYKSTDNIFTLKVDGKLLTVLAGNNSTLTEGLAAGSHYTFSLKVGKEAVSISSVTVAGWDEDEINGGAAEEVTPNTFDATAMTAEQLNVAVTEALEYGHTELAITLAANAPAEMLTAVREALVAADIADGSIDLTLAGVTAIPDNSASSPLFGMIEELGTFNNRYEAVAELRSISLPDAETIGSDAFKMCKHLESVSAPKVQSVGARAFYECRALTSIILPNATSFGEQALDVVDPDTEVTITLTSESEITIHKNCFWWVDNELLDEEVNLVLHTNKQDQVNGNTWTTIDQDGNDVSFTFKQITFVD